MKIAIKGTPKEIADLALELQNRLNEVVCGSLITAAKCGDTNSAKAVSDLCQPASEK